MSAALTAKQRELLDYIRAYQGDERKTPSFDEMREALGLKSKSGVHRLVIALEDRGYIRRLKNHARAIEVVADPHLPDKLSQVSDIRLAQEARRRGLALCHVFEGREYMELRA